MKASLALGLFVIALHGCDDEGSDADADAGPFAAVCESPEHQSMVCVEPGEIVQGSTLPARFDEKDCQVREQTRNTCCNAAQAGPRLIDGQCCYAFCDDSCC